MIVRRIRAASRGSDPDASMRGKLLIAPAADRRRLWADEGDRFPMQTCPRRHGVYFWAMARAPVRLDAERARAGASNISRLFASTWLLGLGIAALTWPAIEFGHIGPSMD